MTASGSEPTARADAGPLAVGVVGVGSMGRHHARVLAELPGTDLVGVADADRDHADTVADQYDTAVMATDDLLAAVDAVSVAVPTRYHADVVADAIRHGTHVLVEKPFVEDIDDGRALVRRAEKRGIVVQVGHVERFNPAVRTLEDVVTDLDIVAIDARRLGPPIDRGGEDGVVNDLMIHDIDVVCSIAGSEVRSVTAGRAPDDPYVSAALTFENDVFATLTASRVTQQKIRELSIDARSCRVHVDYIAQTVRIHRHSIPEYVEIDGDVRYRHESITERPTVDNGEPLKHELSAFVEAASAGTTPPVTGEDGLRALELAHRIERSANPRPEAPPEVNPT